MTNYFEKEVMRYRNLIVNMFFFVCAAILSSVPSHAQTKTTPLEESEKCRSLSGLPLPHSIVTDAQEIPAGDFLASDGKTYLVPAFCKVRLVAVPTEDSHIKIEVWMPASGWNRRYYQLGTGGFAGDMDRYASLLVESTKQGNAVAMTDTGHEGDFGDAAWALRHPQKIIDYGYRSLKETRDNAKRVINAYYGHKPEYAYFSSCSNGGRQAVVAAHRHPEDWDGMLIGAPSNDKIRLATASAWNYQALHKDPQSLIPVSKLPAIQSAALASCSQQAYVVNGVAADPRFCRLNALDLMCNGEETDSCLTASQAEALNNIYQGPRNPRTEKSIFPGLVSTFEDEGEWSDWMIGTTDGRYKRLQSKLAKGFFSNFVFDSSDWDLLSFDFDQDFEYAVSKDIAGESLSDVLSVVSPDFKKMQNQGAKIIMYHGWGDVALTAEGSIQVYENVVETAGGEDEVKDFYRLFMVPGMLHCEGGPGANAFGQSSSAVGLKNDIAHNIHRALEAWVEQGISPEKIIATKYVDDKPEKGVSFTRPLCPYPQVPVYRGTGNVDEVSSFECRPGASPE